MARLSLKNCRIFSFVSLCLSGGMCFFMFGISYHLSPGGSRSRSSWQQDKAPLEMLSLIIQKLQAPGRLRCCEESCAKNKQDLLDNLKSVVYHIMENSDFSSDQLICPSNLYDRILTYWISTGGQEEFSNRNVILKNRVYKVCQICELFFSNTGNNFRIPDNSSVLGYSPIPKLKPKPNFHEKIFISKVSIVVDKNFSDSYFRPRSKIINKDYKFLLHNDSLCSLPGGRRPFLLALVPSVIGNRDTRMTIRTTWGSLAYNEGEWAGATIKETMRMVFIFGSKSNRNPTAMKSLSEEAQRFGDILVADFEDSYRNLSLKMAVGISWIDTFCHGVKHVIKVDEDTFVHVPKLVQLLKTLEKNYSGFVLGHRHNEPVVVRKGRWAVGPEYPFKKFPNYLYGPSYVISGPAIRPLRYTFQHMPLVPNEDAYITGILSKAANLTRLGFPLFAFQGANAPICDISRGKYITVTECCDEHHIAIYGNAKNEHRSCLKLRELRPHRCRFNR